MLDLIVGAAVEGLDNLAIKSFKKGFSSIKFVQFHVLGTVSQWRCSAGKLDSMDSLFLLQRNFPSREVKAN